MVRWFLGCLVEVGCFVERFFSTDNVGGVLGWRNC
jgi:hypothetical protein